MKTYLEEIPVEAKGVVIESETEEEARVLRQIWDTHGGLVALEKVGGDNIQLTLAPIVEA